MPMRALSTASSGMIAQQTHVDVISNNLANVTTLGFKQDRANFSDLLYQEVHRAGVRLPGGNMTPVGKSVGSGVRLGTIDKQFTQGALTLTDNPLDMAIQGDGFFQITMPNGRIGYTRAGNFQVDADGNVVTAQGYFFEPAITVPNETVAVEVSETGNVVVFDGTNSAGSNIGQIELARFINPKGLQSIGGNLYLETDASGQATTGQPGTESYGMIAYKALEESNVEIVREMVDLISAQRAYEVNSNAIKASDEMLRLANNLRA